MKYLIGSSYLILIAITLATHSIYARIGLVLYAITLITWEAFAPADMQYTV